MLAMQEMKRVCQEIKELLYPSLVVLYGKKVNVSSEKIKSFDLCIVVDVEEKLMAEKMIYSNIEASIPFNIIIYTNDEWRECLNDEGSYANFINKKGTIIYEKR